jgi:hypothetical protein
VSTATATNSALLSTAEAVFPPNGTIGYLILLKGDLLLGASAIANDTTDLIATTVPHGLVAGSRVRIAGSPPAPLVAGQDYYAVPSGANDFALATTLANAQANTLIDLSTTGSGLSVNEQQISSIDPPSVLINKELGGGSYQRLLIDNLGSAAIVGSNADHPVKTVSLSNGAAVLTYRHTLIALGAGATIGSTAGITGCYLLSDAIDQTLQPNEVRDWALTFGAKP